MILELNAQEHEVLTDVLRHALGDLREEIYKTDVSTYKAPLKVDEAILKGIIARLAALKTPA